MPKHQAYSEKDKVTRVGGKGGQSVKAPLVGDANIRYCKRIPKEYVEKFNLEGLSFPLQFSQISKLARKNKHIQMSVRVLFESENNLRPRHLLGRNGFLPSGTVWYHINAW